VCNSVGGLCATSVLGHAAHVQWRRRLAGGTAFFPPGYAALLSLLMLMFVAVGRRRCGQYADAVGGEGRFVLHHRGYCRARGWEQEQEQEHVVLNRPRESGHKPALALPFAVLLLPSPSIFCFSLLKRLRGRCGTTRFNHVSIELFLSRGPSPRSTKRAHLFCARS
jgi:hypothetical protein